jgi:hypothetical protein
MTGTIRENFSTATELDSIEMLGRRRDEVLAVYKRRPASSRSWIWTSVVEDPF